MKRPKSSRGKPRPRNPGAASKKKQEESGERASELARKKAAGGFTAAAGDNAGIEKARNGPGCGRFRRDKAAPPRSCPAREKLQIFGIPAAGVFFRESCGKANADNYNFPGRARDKFGRVPTFVDNASCHESAEVKKFPESLGGDIILEYLPPHAPELNPAETRGGRSSARPPARSSGR